METGPKAGGEPGGGVAFRAETRLPWEWDGLSVPRLLLSLLGRQGISMAGLGPWAAWPCSHAPRLLVLGRAGPCRQLPGVQH